MKLCLYKGYHSSLGSSRLPLQPRFIKATTPASVRQQLPRSRIDSHFSLPSWKQQPQKKYSDSCGEQQAINKTDLRYRTTTFPWSLFPPSFYQNTIQCFDCFPSALLQIFKLILDTSSWVFFTRWMSSLSSNVHMESGTWRLFVAFYDLLNMRAAIIRINDIYFRYQSTLVYVYKLNTTSKPPNCLQNGVEIFLSAPYVDL